MKLPSEDTRIGLSIALSAILYLFSYASNITTIVEYFHVGKHNPSMVGVFGASVAFLSFGHMINALIFKLKLGRGNHPVKAAYFFPLIQLSRLVKVVRRTFEFKGFKSLQSEEKSTLFTVVTLALDTAPLLYLQFVMFFVKYAQGRASRITLLSLVASFIAVTYNGGASILSAAKFAKRLREKAVIFAAGGINTFVCIFLRCTTFAATIIWKGWIGPPSFIALVLLVNLVIFWKVYVGAGIWKRLGQTFSAAYVSLCIGPMYAAVSEGFSNKLLLAFILHHFVYDIVVLILSFRAPFGWSFYCSLLLARTRHASFPCKFYIPVVMLLVALCLASVACYLTAKERWHTSMDIQDLESNIPVDTQSVPERETEAADPGGSEIDIEVSEVGNKSILISDNNDVQEKAEINKLFLAFVTWLIIMRLVFMYSLVTLYMSTYILYMCAYVILHAEMLTIAILVFAFIISNYQ